MCLDCALLRTQNESLTLELQGAIEGDAAYGLCQCGCGEPAPLSKVTRRAKGYVKGEPTRFIHGHNKAAFKPNRWIEEDRGHGTPCWIWQLHVAPTGYGQSYDGERVTYAHRVNYERFVGPIPEGLYIDHLCRVRACVNPAHMEPVTNAENIRRGFASRRDAARVS